MPEKDGKIGIGFSFPAEEIQSLNEVMDTSYLFSGSLRFLI